MTVYLELADYLLIAEAVLGVPAELCWHLVKNRPLPDGNKR